MKNMLIAAIALSALLPTATANAQPVAAATVDAKSTLTIAFTGLASTSGSILFSVYDSEAAFDRGGKPVRDAMIPANAAAIQTVIDALPAGRYAIKAFHDVDGDMKMATNPFGMPTEPFAFSNDAVGNMGPAKWADAAFTVTAGANRHSIVIR